MPGFNDEPTLSGGDLGVGRPHLVEVEQAGGKIKKRLGEILKRGYDINRGERELEVAAIAAPIFNHDRTVDTVLAVVGPVQRFSDERIPEILKNLLEATRNISKLLGAPL